MLGGDPMRVLGPQGLVTIAVNIPASARPSLSQGADAFDKTFYNFVCVCWYAYNRFVILRKVNIIAFHKLTWLC